MTSGRIRVGIGGWSYEPWRETFYPSGLPKAKELHHSSRHVTTIEINATYYRTQTAASFRKWAAEAPDDFIFAVKANRYACNRSDLAAGEESIGRFVGSGLTELGAKLGPLLWQLAPTKKFHATEIGAFLALLPKERDGLKLRHVLEVRHGSFVCSEFVALARRHNVAICLALSDKHPLIADPTADFCYLRLQTTEAAVATGYDVSTLKTWAKRAKQLAAGETIGDLPTIYAAASGAPRDCFVYMISGAKERNPAAAAALLNELDYRAAPTEIDAGEGR